MSITPRPWESIEGTVHLLSGDGHTWTTIPGCGYADLIVTAVNEHDALVAKVAASESVLAEVRAKAEAWDALVADHECPSSWTTLVNGSMHLDYVDHDCPHDYLDRQAGR